MSAYIIDQAHAIYLAQAMSHYRIYHCGASLWLASSEEIAHVANTLMTENYKSVYFRYRGNDVEEPETITAADVSSVVFRFDPIQVVKAVDCYQYQACEHDEWKDSMSKLLTDQLQGQAISKIDGYDAAPWGCPQPISA